MIPGHVLISTIARKWKHPRSLLSDEWMIKMWDIYTAAYYSAARKNKSMEVAGKWMELSIVIISEVT